MLLLPRPLRPLLLACRRLHIPPTRHVLTVSVARQTVSLFERYRSPLFARFHPSWSVVASSAFHSVRTFRCSTSRFGIGQVQGSNRTPLGLHRIAEKIGAGWPAGTAFSSRKPVGFTWRGMPEAKITTRILWLEGLEPGLNRGAGVDSHARYIYIHGTGDESALGRPASCGCIHMASKDLIPLFDKLPAGTLVWIADQ